MKFLTLTQFQNSKYYKLAAFNQAANCFFMELKEFILKLIDKSENAHNVIYAHSDSKKHIYQISSYTTEYDNGMVCLIDDSLISFKFHNFKSMHDNFLISNNIETSELFDKAFFSNSIVDNELLIECILNILNPSRLS